MRGKVWDNYYTKLTMISLSAIFLLTCFAVGAIMISLNRTRIDNSLKAHDKVLGELADFYSDIWSNYYKAFLPLMDKNLYADLDAFYSGDGSGYENYELRLQIKKISESICAQDDRIKGVYFQRINDNNRLLYLDKSNQVKTTELVLGDAGTEGIEKRSLIGGLFIGKDGDKVLTDSIPVFGIQSGILPVGLEDTESGYQVTVLYSLKDLDNIVANYGVFPEARFMLTSPQGKVIYDSLGQYAYQKETYYAEVGKLSNEEDTFQVDQVTYRKRLRLTDRGDCLVFYVVPEEAISKFQFDNTVGVVVLLAAILEGIIFVVILSMNQITTRRINELIYGIRQIGKNDLHYRISVGKQEDEFSQIALHFNEMCDDLEDMINKNYVYQILQQNAEYKALQTSVNPHFLYNSLEAIRENLGENGYEDGAEMVLLLARIFEYQIRGENFVPMQKELDALQNYIEFSSIRLQYAFEYSVHFEEEILDCIIPKQIFQPILENYFNHGYRGDDFDFIQIYGYLDEKDEMIHINFSDNGKGITVREAEELNASFDKIQGDNSHIGLRNVHNRVRIAFGEDSYVRIISNEPQPGVCVMLVIGQTLKLDPM